MASTSQTTNHRIYCAVTGTLPPATMSRIPGEDAVKKIAQRARRKMNPRPRAPVSLAGLVMEEEDCRTLRGADMLLYDNGSDERRVIILATSNNQLVENIPDTVQIDPLLDPLLDRVETDLNRTNNYCESFNKTFPSVVGHAHPTIYNFLSAVHLEQASTEGKMHSYRRGVQRGDIWRRILG